MILKQFLDNLHKYIALIVFGLCAIFSFACQSPGPRAAAKNVKEGEQFLIPEAGIKIRFPRTPSFSGEPTTSAESYFSEARSYDCIDPYNDSTTFARHIGVYWNRGDVQGDDILKSGAEMADKMLQNAGAEVLLAEKTQVFGAPAMRIKAYSPENKKLNKEAFYVSLVLFTRGIYLVEMAVFNAFRQDKEWQDDPFILSVQPGGITPESVRMKHYQDDSLICRFLPCYLNEWNAVLHFPGAPMLQDRLDHDQHLQRYQWASVEEDPVLLLCGVEFYKDAPAAPSAKTEYLRLARFLDKSLVEPGSRQQLVSRKEITFRGMPAIDLVTKADLPSSDSGQEQMIIHAIIFMRRDQVVRIYVYLKPGEEDYPEANCFFKSADFW